MFQHMRRFSSTTVKAAATSPISAAAVLYPTTNKEVVRVIENQKRSCCLIEEDEEESNKKPPPPPLEISIRPFQLTDVDDVMVWAADERLATYAGYEEIEIYKSKEKALEEIKNNIIPHPWCKAICLKKNQLPIGTIRVEPYPDEYRFIADLSYVVASKHWGKGIATTAVKMVLDTIFKEWPHLLRLEAGVEVENLASQRVLEKAGFLKEGVHRKYSLPENENERISDVAIFSFLSTDFKRLD